MSYIHVQIIWVYFQDIQIEQSPLRFVQTELMYITFH